MEWNAYVNIRANGKLNDSHWEEVKKGLKIKDFNIANALPRLKGNGDIFKGVLGKGINLDQVLKKIESIQFLDTETSNLRKF